MNTQRNHARSAARVESLLRSQDAAPWSDAPAGLHDRVMASLGGASVAQAELDRRWRAGWQIVAMAASVAIIAGGLGLFAGAAAWRNAPADGRMADNTTSELIRRPAPANSAATEAPTVVLARAFDDLKPAGSSRLVASMAAPMRSEVQGLAAETKLAARTVLSRLPFVSMD